MTASRNTIEDVYIIVSKFVDVNNITQLLNELSHVKGNTSFTKTMKLLLQHHNEETTIKMYNRICDVSNVGR